MHPVLPLLQLIDALVSVEGRKKLQKTVHILKELGAPFSEKFEYSYYGMYSPQLKNEIEALVSEGLVKEESVVFQNQSTGYRISSGDSLPGLLEDVCPNSDAAWIPLAKELNGYSPIMLEGISTLFFLKRAEVVSEKQREKLLELKPHLESVADDCLKRFSELSDLKLAA